jgi:uncharacterized membrane protein YhfC
MLETTYVINFLGMILLPIIVAIYLSRRFKLSWRLFLAGGITFIASQIPHVPLVLALTSTFKSWGIVAYAIVLGLLAGIFEETARYILFKFIRKDNKTWNEGVFIGFGHGGTEAIILGILASTCWYIATLTCQQCQVFRPTNLNWQGNRSRRIGQHHFIWHCLAWQNASLRCVCISACL